MSVTIAVGLGAALLGVVGGFVGALFLETLRLRRSRVGFVRALHTELKQNATAVVGTLYGGRPTATEYSSETWRAIQFEVAQFLNEQLYQELAFLYITLPGIRRISEGSPHGGMLSQQEKELLEAWLVKVRSAMDQFLELPQMSKLRGQDHGG